MHSEKNLPQMILTLYRSSPNPLLQGMYFKNLRICLKQLLIPNPTYTMLFSIHRYLR